MARRRWRGAEGAVRLGGEEKSCEGTAKITFAERDPAGHRWGTEGSSAAKMRECPRTYSMSAPDSSRFEATGPDTTDAGRLWRGPVAGKWVRDHGGPNHAREPIC
jgi:hypothetical protein